MEQFVIVSRHQAAIEFVQLWMSTMPEWCARLEKAGAGVESIPVIATATADDVRGKVVIGNLPLHLAELAASVVAIEFAGQPPRGQEYDLAAMEAAGARLREYIVRTPAELDHLAREVASETTWYDGAIRTGRTSMKCWCSASDCSHESRWRPGPPCHHCGDAHKTANCEA
jgi:hypothetical protein